MFEQLWFILISLQHNSIDPYNPFQPCLKVYDSFLFHVDEDEWKMVILQLTYNLCPDLSTSQTLEDDYLHIFQHLLLWLSKSHSNTDSLNPNK